MKCKLDYIWDNGITLKSIEDGTGVEIRSYHHTECCEDHYIYCGDLTKKDFEGLEFEVDKKLGFIRKIESYGIELVPIQGHTVKIPAYAENNGYYSSQLDLIIKIGNKKYKLDITSCQSWD